MEYTEGKMASNPGGIILEEDVGIKTLLGTNSALLNNCRFVREIGTDILAVAMVLEEVIEERAPGPEIPCGIDKMVFREDAELILEGAVEERVSGFGIICDIDGMLF